jgi:ABC-2 type transport system ATP-binding protein
MDEAQHLADRVAVIAGGRIVAEGSPDSIGGRDHGTAIVAFRLPRGVDVDELPVARGATLIERQGSVRLETEAPTRDVASLMAWAARRGEELEGLTVTRPSLEDTYLELTDEEEAS